MGTAIDIRVAPDPATVDWDDLLAFLHRSFAYMEGRIDPPSSLSKLTADLLREKAKNETLITALKDGRLIGCLFARNEHPVLYLGKIAVEPKDTNRGVGRIMMETVFTNARRGGFNAVELETRIELIENRMIFERLGFEKIAETAHAGYGRPTSIRMRAEVAPR